MADIASQFFSPWDPPPPFVAQPADQKRAEVVQKLAQFAAKNGASFVELIKTKQKHNAEYQFLFGGENFDYYRWVLFASLRNLPADQPLPVAQQHATQTGQQPEQPQPSAAPVQDIEGMLQQTAATCPPEVTTGFSQVLAGLTGSKDSIKQSQQWFMACLQHAPAMAAALALHVRTLPDYDKQLHVLYLTNDILLKRLSQRAPGSSADADDVAQAFKPWLPGILGMAFSTGGRSDQVKERLQKILSFWGDRKLYDKDTMQQLEAALLSGDPNATLQPPAPKQGGKPARRKWDQPAAPAPAAATPTAAAPAQSAHMPHPSSSESTHMDQSQFPQSQGYPQQSVPMQGAFGQQPYQDPTQQQPGYQQPYQQHQGMPDTSMGMQTNPWQQPAGPQQQPWGSHGPATSFGQSDYGQYPTQQHQYPQAMGNMNYPMSHGDATMGAQHQQQPYIQSMHPQQMMQHGMQQYAMQQQGMQQPVGGQWYPPPGAGGVPPQGIPGPPFQSMPMQTPADLHVPPPDLAPPPRKPAHPKADPMSFPPGLIPQLVTEKLRTDPPYSPLSPLDIEKAGLPSTSDPDSYLQSRLDRFYAELQDWRPGMRRTDPGKPKRGTRDEGDDDRGRVPFDKAEPPPSMPSDGSFSGGGGLGFANAGLGFHGAAEDKPADAFDSFREQRSGRYKSSMIKPPPTSFS